MKPFNHTKLSDTLELSECKDGFWLYDQTRGMNLAMRAKTEQMAFVEVIQYYQERLLTIEKQLRELKSKVDSFISSLPNED